MMFPRPCCCAAKCAAPAGAVGREEDQRVRERDPLGGGSRRVGARELDERCRARGVVVQPVTDTAVVAMRHDDDRGGRDADARLLRHEVDERGAAAADRCRERIGVHVEAVRLELAPEPGCGSSGVQRAGPPVGIVGGEVLGDGRRLRRVEGRRQVGRIQRRRAGDAEREQQERQPDQEPGAAVEARVDGTLERPRPRPSALWCGRGGRHSRLSLGRGPGVPFSRGNDSGLGLSAGGKGEARGINIGPRREGPGTLLVEIGGFRFPNLRETRER